MYLHHTHGVVLCIVYLNNSQLSMQNAQFFSIHHIAQYSLLRFIEMCEERKNIMFWETYTDLCSKKGESPNQVAKNLSIASGTVSEWKKGRAPQNAKLKKIADYFGVTVDYLVSGEDKTESPLSDTEKRCVELLKKIPQHSQETALRILEALVQEQS